MLFPTASSFRLTSFGTSPRKPSILETRHPCRITSHSIIYFKRKRSSVCEKIISEEIDSNEIICQEDLLLSYEKDTVIKPKIVLILTALVATLSALDRVAMSVAILPMAAEYGLTDVAKGQISSIFSVGYGLGIIPAGLLVSIVSPKIVMGTGVFLWSLATLATPLVASYLPTDIAPLLIVRAVMGLSESVVLPTIQRILLEWVPPERNDSSVAVATVFGGFQFGTILAYALSPNIMELCDGSWKGIFYVYGAIGILWLIPWSLFVPLNKYSTATIGIEKINDKKTTLELRPNGSPLIVSAVSFPTDTIEKKHPSWSNELQGAPFLEMFKSKGVIAIIIAHAANNWGLYSNLAWAPTFYQEQYHLNVHDSALFSILPPVAGAVGGVFAGTVADNLLKQGIDRTFIRKSFQGLALVGPAICLSILTFFISSFHEPITTPFVAQSLLTCTVGLQAFNAAGYGASAQEKAGDKWSGLLYSVTSLPGVIVGSIAVYATGEILDAGLGWDVVFGLNVLIDLIGAVFFILWYDSKKEFE